ncbi:Fur family transcriptional regulator [Solwaraspora sp. WMMB335]|uniref:Fur family transcriptional regulator n=1 Tax=Solwaraspora sp. WMMB335 TaxID=3404118 RepID=UPI003B922976
MTTTAASARAERAWELLVAAGARRTWARRLVVDVLAASAEHVSVGVIHQRVVAARPQVNISTVHRTVSFLVEHGVAHVLQWPGEVLYGLNESPHVHAVCEQCGRHSELPAGRLAAVLAEARSRSGLDIGSTGIALFGRCPTCAAGPHRTARVPSG